MQKIDQERLDKTLTLYKDELCKKCLEEFHSSMEWANNLKYDWEGDVYKLKPRHFIKAQHKISKWQKGLCEECHQRLAKKSITSGDSNELERLRKKVYKEAGR